MKNHISKCRTEKQNYNETGNRHFEINKCNSRLFIFFYVKENLIANCLAI